MSEMHTMKERNIQQLSGTQKIVKFGVKFGTYAFLIAMALIVLFPFYWMLLWQYAPDSSRGFTIPHKT